MKKILLYPSLFILSWIYALVHRNADLDLWMRMAVGKVFLDTGEILKHDIFAFCQTKPQWIDHEWGSGVIFYFLGYHFGDVGLLLLKILIFFLILVLISKTINLQKNSSGYNILFYFLIIAAIYNGLSSTVRCQIFTFFFFALWIYVLERVRKGGENSLLWIFPATMLIWANLHGGFVAGLGLLLIYGFGEFLNRKPFKKYFLILIPTLLITLINPYGIDYLVYIIKATTMPRPHVFEWMPTELFGSIKMWFGFKLLLLISIISLVFSFVKNKGSSNSLDKVKYLLLIFTLYLALKHVKHQPFFVIVAGSFIYSDFYSIFSIIKDYLTQKFGNKIEKPLNNLALVKDVLIYLFIILAGNLLISNKPLRIEVSDTKFPVGSIEFIRQNKLSGKLLTTFNWGSYAAWNLYPNCLIAIDGRYEEVYPQKTVDLTSNFIYVLDKNWYDFAKIYKLDILLLEKGFDSYPSMLQNKFWKEIYNDKISAVFVPVAKVKKSYLIPDLDVTRNKYYTNIK